MNTWKIGVVFSSIAWSSLCIADEPEQPVLAKAVVRDLGVVTGELVDESADTVRMLKFDTGKAIEIPRSEILRLRVGISEGEAIGSAGLSDYLAWCVRKAAGPATQSGKVAAIEDGFIYVTGGKSNGIRLGQRFKIWRQGEPIHDPDSGEEIGRRRVEIAEAKAVDVQDKVAKAQVMNEQIEDVMEGDDVRPLEEKSEIAILPLVDSNGRESVYSRGLSEELTTGCVKLGIAVIERRLLVETLSELSLQQTSFFDPEIAAKIGKQVGVNLILMGTISPKKKSHVMNFRVVDVETGEILFAASYNIRNEDMTPVFGRTGDLSFLHGGGVEAALNEARFLDFFGRTWNNDIREQYEIRRRGASVELVCNATSGYEHKLVVFGNHDPQHEKLVTVFEVEAGIFYVHLRPIDLSPMGANLQFPFEQGKLYEVELWIEGDVAKATVNGESAPVMQEPTCFGYFTFAPSNGARIRLHELRFVPTSE